jgi:hypothetical protein
LYDNKGSGADAKGEIDADVLSYVRITTISAVDLGPVLEPDTATYRNG